MFRALLCSSPGGQNCVIQHLVSSHCVGGRPVHCAQHTWRSKACYRITYYIQRRNFSECFNI